MSRSPNFAEWAAVNLTPPEPPSYPYLHRGEGFPPEPLGPPVGPVPFEGGGHDGPEWVPPEIMGRALGQPQPLPDQAQRAQEIREMWNEIFEGEKWHRDNPVDPAWNQGLANEEDLPPRRDLWKAQVLPWLKGLQGNAMDWWNNSLLRKDLGDSLHRRGGD